MNDDLCIGHRVEAVSLLFERLAQLKIIEDFAIEHDPDALVLIVDRLPASLQIDDAQPRVREPHSTVAIEPEAVGAAVPHHRNHPFEGVKGYFTLALKIKYAR